MSTGNLLINMEDFDTMENQKGSYLLKIFRGGICSMLVLLITGCSNLTFSDLEQAGFKSQLWINDSLACEGYRHSNYQLVLDNTSTLKNANYAELIRFFGQPNIERVKENGEKILIYVVEPDPLCLDSLISGSRTADVASIFFRFEHTGLVSKIGMTMP